MSGSVFAALLVGWLGVGRAEVVWGLSGMDGGLTMVGWWTLALFYRERGLGVVWPVPGRVGVEGLAGVRMTGFHGGHGARPVSMAVEGSAAVGAGEPGD